MLSFLLLSSPASGAFLGARNGLLRPEPIRKVDEVVGASKLPGMSFGYLPANTKYNVNYFYWLYAPADGNVSAPVVSWLTGGPGCSSELAMFFENGPYNVNSSGQLVPNPYGWNAHAYLLYVDQPGGTGFSTVGNPAGYVANEAQVAADYYTFLGNFFKKFPSLASHEYVLVGESYAGHYVPAISAYIAKKNAGGAKNQINLKHVAVGNGLVDPLVQNGAYGPFLAYAAQLITQNQLKQMQAQYAICAADIKSQNYEQAFEDCNQIVGMGLEFGGNFNVYDYKLDCECGQLCYCQIGWVTKFMNNPTVQKQLGVKMTWQACDMNVYSHLENDFEQNYLEDVPYLLSQGVPVTFYNGVLDFICNYYGTAAMLNQLSWPGQAGFNGAANVTWVVDGQTAGTARSYDGLTFVTVNGAGHMVPHDQPAAALDLLTRITTGTPFADPVKKQ